MMKYSRTILMAVLLSLASGCATQLGMNPPQKLDIQGIQQYPYAVGLYIPRELQEYVYEKRTSPLDIMTYPIGEQTTALFRKNLPVAFKSVLDLNSLNPSQDVKLVLQPSIVKFESEVPNPAYNPYTATVVYRIDVYDRKGEKVYSQTATGEAQTSKGLMSGFRARTISAEVAQTAMGNAMRQLLDGLASANELKDLN